MVVERKDGEIVVRFSAGKKASKIQAILDYLRYEELSSKSEATEEDVENLVNEAKSNRWDKVKKELGLDE